jgi:hypothetical protein
MKYTIEGFAQDKLIALRLDMPDASILRWFVDFAASNKMKKLAAENTVYYLVRYDGILADLPILGITSIKGLSKRFDKYVEKGLLKKAVKRNGSGTDIYYAFTDKVVELQYSTAVPSDNATAPERNSGSFQGKASSAKGTPVPFSGSRKELQFSSERNSGSDLKGTPVPLPLNNSSTTTHLLNSAATAHESHVSTFGDIYSAADRIKQAMKKYFDTDIFSKDIFPALACLLHDKYSEIEGYIDFVYQNGKTAENKAAYFYKTAAQNYMFAKYLETRKNAGKEKPAEKIICPVCGTEHPKKDIVCPVCGISYDELGDAEKISHCRNLFRLSPEKKKQMEQEIAAISNKYRTADGQLDFSRHKEIKAATDAVYTKYTA